MRDLLVVLILCGIAAAMARGVWPAPELGPPVPVAVRTVDVNRASADELASLDGIGPHLAARIIAGRPYARVDDLIRVKGIGAKRLAALRPRLRI